jgi:transcription antitermination factor NusG
MDSCAVATHLSEKGEALPLRGEELNRAGIACPGSAKQHRWYAVHTFPRHEKRIREHMGDRDVDCFLPVYQTVRRWRNGCDSHVEAALFPGYLFVRINPENRVRVLEVPGVLSIVGAGREPSPLPDSEIEALREGLQHYTYEPHAYLAVGQRVQIKAGPLAGWTGILVRKNGGLRVVLALDQIMQGVAVEVSANDIEITASILPCTGLS